MAASTDTVVGIQKHTDANNHENQQYRTNVTLELQSRCQTEKVNLLFRSFLTRNRSVLVKAYVTYVRPILEYNSVVWSPYKIADVSCIEKVQRSFTKRLPGLNNLTYRERLVVTKLDSLELRRLRVDLIMCYKIVFRLISMDFCAFFRFAPSCNTRGHGCKLFAEQCTHNLRYHSFARRVVGPWNRLPAHVDFSSLALGSRLFLIVLICLIFCYIVLIRVDVSVPSGAFLSLAGILLFYLCCWCCHCQC